MVGMDKKFLDKLDFNRALKRISSDIFTDFIFAPHYNLIFTDAKEELISKLKTQLKTGTYEPKLPISIEVIKKSGMGRPGTILNPIDRLAYQVIVDSIAEKAEENIDREKVYSNVLNNSNSNSMFISQGLSYKKLKDKLETFAEENHASYILYLDIANFFEKIYQHILINSLRSVDVNPEYVSILEKLLSAFTQKDSHGIIQGVYPSDFLGNYYLTSFDDFLRINDLNFLRFVDDYWIFFDSKEIALKKLVEICKYLRKEGLSLNESKISLSPIKNFIYEETKLDKLFEEIRENFKEVVTRTGTYGFEQFEIEIIPEDAEFNTIVQIYNQRDKDTNFKESIDKFCIPYLAKYGSDIAVNAALKGIVESPHMVRIYSQYLGIIAKQNNSTNIYSKIEKLLKSNKILYSWQKLWLYSLLFEAKEINFDIVDMAHKLLLDRSEDENVRAICAIILGKHGSGPKIRFLRNHYSNESSEYVKDAILYATKYFPSTDERNSCIKSWSKHDTIKELIAQAINNEKQNIQNSNK